MPKPIGQGMTITYEEIISVACPVCRVNAGEGCVETNNKPRPKMHLARMQKAKEIRRVRRGK